MKVELPWHSQPSENVDSVSITLKDGTQLIVKEDVIEAYSADGSTVTDIPMTIINRQI